MESKTAITTQSHNISTSPVIVVEHLYKAYENKDVLVDFDLRVQQGESVVIIGKSGAGKSVLIKCIIGLTTPDAGVVEVFGEDVLVMDDDQLDKLRSKVGFLFQANALYDSMTVRENLEFPLRRHKFDVSQEEVNKRVKSVLQDVGLEHTIDMMPGELSGGMRKRIALARTLMLHPKVILYDEPTTGLDVITGKEIIELMKRLQHKYQITSLIISHDMNCVRMASDRVVILWNGSNYAEGTYQQLVASDDPIIQQFFQ